MRFLVVGCGSIGKRHIRNLLALDAGPILAFDVRAERRREVVTQFGVQTVDNLDDGWNRDCPVALITAPTSVHVPMAVQAAEHGCHLFIEKPLSDRMDGVDRLLDLVRNQDLVTLVGCNMRFHPGLVKVKKLLEEGAIGRVVAARVEVGQYLPDWHPKEDYRQSYSAHQRMGGGVILDAIHEIDYIRWMLGEVETLACLAGNLSKLEIETEDTAAILVRFTSGAIGEIHLDYVQRSYSRTCQIIGDEGTIRWDYTRGEVRYYSSIAGDERVFPVPRGWEPNQMYIDEMRHFLSCLAGQEKTKVDVFEAKRVLKVALAARASVETGKFVRVHR